MFWLEVVSVEPTLLVQGLQCAGKGHRPKLEPRCSEHHDDVGVGASVLSPGKKLNRRGSWVECSLPQPWLILVGAAHLSGSVPSPSCVLDISLSPPNGLTGVGASISPHSADEETKVQ